MFIVFEGGEGAGKTTQAKMLADALRSRDIPVVATREPGGTPQAEALRNIVVKGEPGSLDGETELLIFCAARREHLLRVIRPALDRGDVVICDRFVGSTHALQGAAGVDTQSVDLMHKMFCWDQRPDITFYLKGNTQNTLERAMGRNPQGGDGRFEAKGLDFHKKVSGRFNHLANTERGWVTVDANLSMDQIHREILQIVLIKRTLGRPGI